MRRLGAGAVNFQIAHHDERPAAEIEVDERVGHEQADGIKHVRVALAVRDDEQGFVQSVDEGGRQEIKLARLEFGQFHAQIQFDGMGQFGLAQQTQKIRKIVALAVFDQIGVAECRRFVSARSTAS